MGLPDKDVHPTRNPQRQSHPLAVPDDLGKQTARVRATVWLTKRGRGYQCCGFRYQCAPCHPKEGTVFAIVAAILFGLAVLLDLANANLGGTISIGLIVNLGLLCLALHVAGFGSGRSF